MSIPNLPPNFKDDILAATNQKRKYNLIQNDDGTVSFEDATEYQQTGSDFGAGQINSTNDAINKAYSERILNLEEVELVTEPGYFVDALAVKEVFTELNGNISNILQKQSKENRINVSAGQKVTSYIIIDAIDGYTPVLATVWSSHVTTTTSDARIVDDRVMFYFDATSNQTPETFTADVVYIKNL